jgi:xylan 1,4-beta-xylosidase
MTPILRRLLIALILMPALARAQEVIAPGHVPPAAPLLRYVYNLVAADFSTPAGHPLIKTKFSLFFGPPDIEQFDASIAKMGELNVDTYRTGLGWTRGTRDIVSGTADKLVFKFDPLDHIVKQLRSQDVLLLGAYSGTPPPLQDPNLEPRYGPGQLKRKESTPPKDISKWKEVIAALVRHQREIGLPFGVHEVWNEPDGTYQFWSGTEAEYQQLYQATVEAVREVDPDAVVAGPSADHHMYWNMSFVDFVLKNKLPLDHYTFHEYGSGEMAIRQVERANSSLNRYPYFNATALSLDEYHDGECCNWCNDDVRNRYEGASELLHDFTLLLGRPELASVSWAWWQDPPGRGGCMGLLTADGRRKAVFNAWKIYAMMPVDRRQVTIERGLEAIASSDDHKASLLIWNRSSYDRRCDAHLKNLPFQSGTVRIYRIDSKHASPGDGAEENLVASETYPITDAAGWSYLDGQIPKYGTIYLEADDGTGLSQLTPARVGNVIRINRYYPARGKTKSYSDFDRKTWIARLGMMDDGTADQRIGILADGLPDTLDIAVKIEGKPQKVDANSLLGVRIDYRVGGQYTKAVLFHGALFDSRRRAAMPWGLKGGPEDIVAVPDFGRFQVPLKEYAPSGWGGKVHISFLMQHAGPGARARFTVRPGQ